MKFGIFLAALLSVGSAAEAKVVLPAVFADQMVLQRDSIVPIWGRAEPGESVTVSFAGQSKVCTADAEGKWMLKLDAMPANTESRVLEGLPASPFRTDDWPPRAQK